MTFDSFVLTLNRLDQISLETKNIEQAIRVFYFEFS